MANRGIHCLSPVSLSLSGDCPAVSSMSASLAVDLFSLIFLSCHWPTRKFNSSSSGSRFSFPQHFHVSADITHTQRAVRLFAHLFIKNGGEKEGKEKWRKRRKGNFLWWFRCEQKSFNLSVCLSLSLSLPPSLFHFVIILFIYVLWGHAPCLPACVCVQPTCSCHFNNTFNVLPASTSADAFHL